MYSVSYDFRSENGARFRDGGKGRREEGKENFSLGFSDGEQRLASHRDVTEIEFTKLALELKVKVERTSGNGSEA